MVSGGTPPAIKIGRADRNFNEFDGGSEAGLKLPAMLVQEFHNAAAHHTAAKESDAHVSHEALPSQRTR